MQRVYPGGMQGNLGPEEESGRYALALAQAPAEVSAAQRLRHLVFFSEPGVVPATPPGRLERDSFDGYCDHLLVREVATGEMVGTYRILPPAGARAAGGLYAETEFDLSRMRSVLPDTAEIGRACVHPDHRDGGQVIALLWSGLQDYLLRGRFGYAIGCASVPAREPERAAALSRTLLARYLGEHRAAPIRPFDFAQYGATLRAPIPSLLRSYLRLGATICGPPASDPVFATVDFLLLLPLRAASFRHAERIIRRRNAA